MNNKNAITQDGLDDLKKELEVRKEKLKETADRIDEARQQGDLSENAAYTMALSEKELNEAKIKELEDKISESVVVTGNSSNDKVDIGEKVVLRRLSDDQKFTYELVGAAEADPSSGKISIDSPLGRALGNKKKGDKAKVDLPSGEEVFIIEEIL